MYKYEVNSDDYWNSAHVIDFFSNTKVKDYIKDFFGNYDSGKHLKVADLGCGAGRYTIWLAQNGYDVYACDASEGMLNKTKEGLEKIGYRDIERKILKSRLNQLAFDDEMFDIVLTNGVIHNAFTCEEYIQCLKECVRILKTTGVLYLSVFTSDAVMSITWSETCAYLDRIGLRQNERVLLLGSGAVALSFALMLQLGKIRVCIVGSRRYQARFATLDEAEYIDYSDYQAMEKLRASNKSSFDCIIDAVGDRKTTENCLELLKENGKLCLYGLKDGKLYEYFRQRRFGEHFYVYDESYSVKHAYKEVFGMIQEKQLYSEQWFDKIYELSDIQKALEDLENRKAMKVLFRFPSE